MNGKNSLYGGDIKHLVALDACTTVAMTFYGLLDMYVGTDNQELYMVCLLLLFIAYTQVSTTSIEMYSELLEEDGVGFSVHLCYDQNNCCLLDVEGVKVDLLSDYMLNGFKHPRAALSLVPIAYEAIVYATIRFVPSDKHIPDVDEVLNSYLQKEFDFKELGVMTVHEFVTHLTEDALVD